MNMDAVRYPGEAFSIQAVDTAAPIRPTGAPRAWAAIPLVLFALHFVLSLPVLVPQLKDLGLFDESRYVELGSRLSLHTLPMFDESPLTTMFFRLTYLPFRNSDLWMLYSDTLGRFVLFALLWASAYLLAARLAPLANPLVVAALLVVSPAVTSLVTNGSHALFASLSALALSQMLAFRDRQRLRHIWIASICVGLALIARLAEGTFVALALLASAGLLGSRARRLHSVILAATVPLMLIAGGYISVFSLSTGTSPFGIGEYAYIALEQGHAIAFQNYFEKGPNFVKGELDAERIFGSGPENGYSVVAAIRRNPSKYFSRVPRLGIAAAGTAIGMFGGPVAVSILFFAAYGALQLARRKEWFRLGILLLWPGYLILYVTVVFQPTHLLLPFAIVFSFASIGMTTVVSAAQRERAGVVVVLAAAIILTIVTNRSLPFIAGAVALLATLMIVWIAAANQEHREAVVAFAVAVLLGGMLLFRDPVPRVRLRELGQGSEEQAVIYIAHHFRRDTGMAAYSVVPRAARMRRVNLEGLMLFHGSVKEWSGEQLRRWMADNRVEAIYVDKGVTDWPELWKVLRDQIGQTLEVGFSTGNGAVHVLRPIPTR